MPIRFLGEFQDQMLPAENETIGAHVVRIIRLLAALGEVDLNRKPRGDRTSDLILKIEKLLQLHIEPIGPQHALGSCVDQLDGDAQTLVGPAQAPAENVADAESLSDILGAI